LRRNRFLIALARALALIMLAAALVPLTAAQANPLIRPNGSLSGTARSNIAGHGRAQPNTNLIYWGGPVVTGTLHVYVIFWEPTNWSPVAPGYNALLERYYQDLAAESSNGQPTGFYQTLTQYYQENPAGAPINEAWGGAYVDTTPYPSVPVLTVSELGAEVQKDIQQMGWPNGGLNNYFPVYLAHGEKGPVRPDTTYCGTHFPYSLDFKRGPIYFTGYIDYPDACQNVPRAPNASQCGGPVPEVCDNAISLSAHEEVENVTDPYDPGGPLSAWYVFLNQTDKEVADMCQLHGTLFGPLNYDHHRANQAWPNYFDPSQIDYYTIQEIWDNAQSQCVQSGP